MKNIFVFLTIVAFTAPLEVPDPFAERTISSTIADAIINIRDQMPCGFPKHGIPPLAPLKIAKKDIRFAHPILNIDGSVSNFRLSGLNDFEIVELKIHIIARQVVFRFQFKNIDLETMYDMKSIMKYSGFTINVVGSGPAKFTIKNMSVWGTVNYSLGLLSGKVKIRNLEVRTHIEDIDSDIKGVLGEDDINYKLNGMLANAFQIAANQNLDFISKNINSWIVPKVNKKLAKYTLRDIMNLTGNSSDESTVCNPLEQ